MVEVEDYKLLAPLGQGVSGQVYVAERKEDKKLFALKFIDRFYKDQQQEEHVILMLEQEVNAIEMVDSDRVVKSTECFTTEDFFVIVMDYCQNGDLFNYVKAKGCLEESEAMELLAQILDGIKAVHSKNLIHRDIKPENLLLDDHFLIKIGDFGASIIYNKECLLDNLCGTYYYMAPELENYEEYDFSVDLWSIGCVLFFMLTGKQTDIFQIDKLYSIKMKVFSQFRVFQSPHDPHRRKLFSKFEKFFFLNEHVQQKTLGEDHEISISSEVKDLISKMLKYNPEDRISFSDILKHAAIKKYRDCPSVKKLISQEKNYTEIYQSQVTLNKILLTHMTSTKKHDFSPQKSKVLLLNTSYNNIPSMVHLNSVNNSSDNKKQRSLLITQYDIDEVLLSSRQDSIHAIPLARKESEFFLNRQDYKNTIQNKQKIKLVDSSTPQCKIPLSNTQSNDQDLGQSVFSINSDEFLEEDDSVSKKISHYSNNCNIMIIKNKISNDPNSPNYRGLNPDSTLSPTQGTNTPQSKSAFQKSPYSQFSDISPINVNKIK